MDFGNIIEEKIKQSIARGEFENLPGKGKPLPKDELAYVPDELRNSYRILKNAHMLPEEMQIKKEIVEIEALIKVCENPEQEEQYEEQLSEKRLRFNILMEKRKNSRAFSQYRGKINNKFGI
ncbi:DUF1992 domain-containing protein [Halobacillus salinarum]|uniref:DUF1992 domain-containing protein n=1 Tax=Halobacillus salinarum TaxID=2932257 RepID=A0ABY4EHC6_9BACI|nr:DUF1992 domain-containing protein [Halobacillus salinarum]UOQ43853.1 DUF1992 domain-containing protein [Halobacillus salinarum]